MNARIYVRVSTQEQAQEGFSIAQQLRQCRAFCRSQGWALADEYIDDGYSAKDTDRPALQRLLKDLQSGDVVVVWRLDRLTRSVLDLHTLLQRFEQNGAGFRSVTEPYDTTTAIGRLFVTLVAALAQWERENLGERVVAGMTEMVRQGRWHGGPLPFGYQYDQQQRRLVPDPATAPLVREIFERFVRGDGTRAIAIWLNDIGVRTRSGAGWTPQAVSYVLRNPIYTGRLAFRKRKPQGTRIIRTPHLMVLSPERTHEPLVADAVFDEAQRIIARRAEGKLRTSGHVYPLSGILYCGRCGSPMMGTRYQRDIKRGRYRYYYICVARKKLKACDMPFIRQERLEAQVVAQLSVVSSIPLEQAAPPDEGEIRRLEAEARELARRKARWYDAYESGAITVNDLRERTAAIVQREAEVQKRLADLMRASERLVISADEWRAAMLDLQERWQDMEPVERKLLLHDLLARVTVLPDRSVVLERRV